MNLKFSGMQQSQILDLARCGHAVGAHRRDWAVGARPGRAQRATWGRQPAFPSGFSVCFKSERM